MPHDDPLHYHSWSPIPGWAGRYRCVDPACDVVAHRSAHDDGRYVIYVCGAFDGGKKCGAPAVEIDTRRKRHR